MKKQDKGKIRSWQRKYKKKTWNKKKSKIKCNIIPQGDNIVFDAVIVDFAKLYKYCPFWLGHSTS